MNLSDQVRRQQPAAHLQHLDDVSAKENVKLSFFVFVCVRACVSQSSMEEEQRLSKSTSLLESQHHHLLHCLEKTTVSARTHNNTANASLFMLCVIFMLYTHFFILFFFFAQSHENVISCADLKQPFQCQDERQIVESPVRFFILHLPPSGQA